MSVHASHVNAYSKFTAEHDRSPRIVDVDEAKELIKIAGEINSKGSGCCSYVPSNKGDRSLAELVQQRGDHFEPASLSLINYWLANHRLPSGSNSASPSASRPVGSTTPANPPVAEHGKVILDWKSGKQTWHCHWFPMKASVAGGDPINNLYAPGGALEKYDAAFKKDARNYELASNAKAHNSSGFDWWGHCNNASQASALLREPVKDVVMNGVTFTAHDISGLLCKVVPSLCNDTDFKGNRYNGPSDNPNDPNPADFLESVLKAWCKPGESLPFILDIDRTDQVWNYPFDQARVYESDKAPMGFTPVSSGGKTKYYRAELKGTGYKEQERNYQFWIQYDSTGKPAGQGWIAGLDPKISPDFAWRSHPVGDLNNAAAWVTNPGAQNNPKVNAEDVYRLYKASIA